jgi:DNA-binding LacI/PurR family transcriptional regulator
MTDADAPAKRPTIMEVARLAGVSHQTVSRYLRFNGGLKPATRDRVDAAIKELNYRPNLVARSMRTKRTGRLAILMPAVSFSPARLLTGATEAAHSAGFVVEVVSIGGGAEARSERLLELAESSQLEGILSLAPILPSTEAALPDTSAVVVSADFDDEMRGIGELADATPVADLIERLAELGHRRFLHVAGAQSFASARGRKQTYLETIERLGLESIGVVDGDWSGESGMSAMLELDARRRPTAVIAANDLVASGVIRGALLRGWSVPDDMSVTGWDNNPLGMFFAPALTTVDIDLERLGYNAMTRLIAAVRKTSAQTSPEPLHSVIWRESTGPAPEL